MRNYFIAGLGTASLEVVRQAGVTFSDFNLAFMPGILIDEEQLSRVLRALNMRVVQEDVTGFDGVYALTLGPINPVVAQSAPSTPPTELRVQHDNWGDSLHRRGAFLKMVEDILLPVVLKRIIVHGYESGKTMGPRSDGIFRIFIWSGAFSEKGSGDYSEEVWGYSFGSARMWFAPSGEGIAIRVPENEAVIAEIIGDNLYILAPVAYYSFSDGPRIFRRILQEVAAELSLSPEQRVERDRQRAEAEKVRLAREHAESRVRYIELCKQRLLQVVEDARVRVRESEGVLEQVQGSIVVTQRELTGSKRKLEQLRLVKTAEDKRFAEEFEKICAVPEVEEVRMLEGKTLQIMTSVLVCRDPNTGKFYELGKFRIDLPINGGNVRWFNLTRRVDGLEPGMHSPVVDGNGCTLLFNAIQAFPELIASYEIATAVMLALQVPGSIDPNEEYAKYLDKWPEVAPAASAA